jgi:hypothetical protein
MNPDKLIHSAKAVYGEEKFNELYGTIQPIPQARVQIANPQDAVPMGDKKFVFYDAPGHAKHHLFIMENQTQVIFSGDSFGIGYPRFCRNNQSFVFPSTSPTQFQPEQAMQTYRQIINLQPSHILLTHFGPIFDHQKAFQQLTEWISFCTACARQHYQKGLRSKDLYQSIAADLKGNFQHMFNHYIKSELSSDDLEYLQLDIDINAQGLADYIEKLNR